MKRLTFLLIIAFSANICYADSGWSQTGRIVEVYNLGWTVAIRIEGAAVDYSNGACANSFYALNSSEPGFANILSQILMAHAAGMRAMVWLNGAICTGQFNSHQKIDSIKTSK
jgi:hypothetical protein